MDVAIKDQDQETKETEPREIKTDHFYWKYPERSDIGYLKRSKTALKYREEFLAIKKEAGDAQQMTPEALDAMVKFLSIYVVEPDESPEHKVEALEEYATEEQVEKMLRWTMPGLFEKATEQEGIGDGSVELDPISAPES